MVDVVSRSAVRAEETHAAWLAAVAQITRVPGAAREAPCPNCGHFSLRFQYVADEESRIGMCTAWCEHCNHGHVVARARVPDGIEFLSLDASPEVIAQAIPRFVDATSPHSTESGRRETARP